MIYIRGEASQEKLVGQNVSLIHSQWTKMVKIRGAESEPEPESESTGVVGTSQESGSGSEPTKLPSLRLRNVLFECVIKFVYAVEKLDALFGKYLCRYRL